LFHLELNDPQAQVPVGRAEVRVAEVCSRRFAGLAHDRQRFVVAFHLVQHDAFALDPLERPHLADAELLLGTGTQLPRQGERVVVVFQTHVRTHRMIERGDVQRFVGANGGLDLGDQFRKRGQGGRLLAVFLVQPGQADLEFEAQALRSAVAERGDARLVNRTRLGIVVLLVQDRSEDGPRLERVGVGGAERTFQRRQRLARLRPAGAASPAR
jgi:hypothetical protein